jgi:Ca2+-binding EF-hand superfamily protein
MLSKFTTLTTIAATWMVVMVIPAGAQAQTTARMRFESMDLNRDGVITRDEWRGSDRAFQNQDWNGDGRLSGNEVRLGARRDANYEEADHEPNRYERYVSWTTAGFNNLDHNRDRRISANEWHFDVETFRRVDRNRDGFLSQPEFLGGDIDDARDASFDDLDWNNNGRVERSEWNGSDSVFTSLDRNRDGVLTRFEVVGGVNAPNDTYDEFGSLDYNRNGSITRDEWHWSAVSFDRRDTNRDGRISRQEFAVNGGAPGAVGTSGGLQQRTVRVNSQQRWTDSGIVVRAGETVTLDASGTIQMSDDGSDTANPAGSTKGRRAPDAPVLNQLAGGLIAQIDNYGPIYLGGRRTFTAPVNGRLYFGVNDDHLPDNRGEFNVNVNVTGR